LRLPIVKIAPTKVYLQKDEHNIFLNFDFQIQGVGKKFSIVAIIVFAYDKYGNLLVRKSIDSNGISPSILTVPSREIPEKGIIDVFNPFYRFEATFNIDFLKYIFHLMDENNKVVKMEVQVRPTQYFQQARLRLPFNGYFIVYDGHDYYSHHRRFPLSHPLLRQMKIQVNSSRYAYDFCATDEDGNLHSKQVLKNEDYYTFGKPVYAPGDGVIVEAVQNIRDNVIGEPAEHCLEDFIENPKLLAGNYVVIDHGTGEYSMMGHFKQHSLKVQVGDKVSQGQILGLAGNSGASEIPHIHYQLQSGRDILSSEGLPCIFKEYDIILGNTIKHITSGFPKTGERLRNRLNAN
jgi:hypothetical protein